MPQYRCPQCRVIFESIEALAAGEFAQCPRCALVVRPILYEPAEPQAAPPKPTRTVRPTPPPPAPLRRPPVEKPAARPQSAPARRPAPVEDPDERPRRHDRLDRGPRSRKPRLPLALIVGGAAALGVTVAGLGITVLVLLTRSSPSVHRDITSAREFAQASTQPVRPPRQTPPAQGSPLANQPTDPLLPPGPGPTTGLSGGVPLDLPAATPPPSATAPVAAGGAMTPAILKKVKAATVMIRVTIEEGRASGSGFFALGSGLVLTNAHVVGMLHSETPPASLDVIVNSGERNERTLTGRVVAVDRTSDLAAIRLSSSDGLPAPLPVIGAGSLIETQQLWVFGFPLSFQLGKNITVSATTVSSLRKDADGFLQQVQVNGGMNHGNSGGPVVDADGRVVGVAVAGIEGTQINFAIPGDKVVGLLHGRLSEMVVGEAMTKNGKIVVPVTLATLDPLQSIKKLEVDWWFAPPGSPRPPSMHKPTPTPGEKRQTVPVTYQSAASRGQAELALPGLPPAGQVLWVQPTIVDATGQPRWAAAVGKLLESPPEPKYVMLVRRPRSGQAPLDLSSTLVLRLRKGGEQRALKVKLLARMLEKTRRPDALGTTVDRLNMKHFEARFSLDDQPARVSTKTARAIQDAGQLGMDLAVDRSGNIVHSQTVVAGMSEESRGGLERFATQIRDSLDLAAVRMPGGVRPGQMWKARRRLPSIASEQQSGSVLVTYTYLGVRKVNGKECAVVSLSGLARNASGRPLSGRASGKALVEVATGRVVQATATVELSLDLDFEGETVNAKGSLEVRLGRGDIGRGG